MNLENRQIIVTGAPVSGEVHGLNPNVFLTATTNSLVRR